MNWTPFFIAACAVLFLAVVFLLVLLIQRKGGGNNRIEEEKTRAELLAHLGEVDRRLSDLRSLFNEQLQGTQKLLQERITAQDTALRDQLSKQTATMQGQTGILQKHMQSTQSTLAQVTEKMGMVQQASKRMGELGKDIEDLQRLLRAPKTRGELGELGLRTILDNILPSEFVDYQHTFKDGKKVDAIIKLGKGLLPIDAKFPVEDFRRYAEAPEEERASARRAFKSNVKKKIDSIASLYIRPGEGTLPLALMYLPAESLYYEAFVSLEKDEIDLWNHAFSKSVLPLSPATLVAYLKTVAMGLKAVVVERESGKVLELLGTLERDVATLGESHRVLGRHVDNAYKSFQKSSEDLRDLANDVERVKALGSEARREARENPSEVS